MLLLLTYILLKSTRTTTTSSRHGDHGESLVQGRSYKLVMSHHAHLSPPPQPIFIEQAPTCPPKAPNIITNNTIVLFIPGQTCACCMPLAVVTVCFSPARKKVTNPIRGQRACLFVVLSFLAHLHHHHQSSRHPAMLVVAPWLALVWNTSTTRNQLAKKKQQKKQKTSLRHGLKVLYIIV